jgi:signal transducer and activator of transcription 5B
MAAALNMKWTSACGTNRGLTEDNLYYLATKAFRNPNLCPDDFKSLVISWSQFCREPLPDRNFTFWEWFYRVMNLTATHMRGKSTYCTCVP